MPKKTLQCIIATGNHYVVQLKANQGKLFRLIAEAAAKARPLACFHDQSTARGRYETRTAKLYDAPQAILSGEWTGVKTIIVVERSRRDKQQTLLSTSYYLSSIASSDAGFFACGIRNHWLIENKLHYVKDVVLNEDNSLIRKELPAANISLLKTIAMNLLRTNGFDSVKNGISFFANKIKELFLLMRT